MISLHLGIDATNIRLGGGITHLSQLLQAGDPIAAGFSRVTVWTSESTAAALPERPWLVKMSSPWMDASLPRRMVGQQFQLPLALTAAGCEVLFSPGGTLPVCGHPCQQSPCHKTCCLLNRWRLRVLDAGA